MLLGINNLLLTCYVIHLGEGNMMKPACGRLFTTFGIRKIYEVKTLRNDTVTTYIYSNTCICMFIILCILSMFMWFLT